MTESASEPAAGPPRRWAPPRIENAVIPQRGWFDRASFWPTNEDKASVAESKILQRAGVGYSSYRIPIDMTLTRPGWFSTDRATSQEFINTLVIHPQSEDALFAEARALPPPLQSDEVAIVMAHGFGAALGFWWQNFSEIAQVSGARRVRIYAFDWLGMGRSSRPAFPVTPSSNPNVTEAEDFFVDSLEEWRKACGLESFVLVGHSLGGYLACVYAIKHVERVEKLILVSPVGLPSKPPDGLPMEQRYPKAFRTLEMVWSIGLTPQSALRAAGPMGPAMMYRYTDRRFAHLDAATQEDVHEYTYHTNALPGSGEYALNTILQPLAYARLPLVERMSLLHVPTVFIYGQYDWMTSSTGYECTDILKARGIEASCHIIPDAGHQIHIDEPRGFNSVLCNELKPVAESAARKSYSPL